VCVCGCVCVCVCKLWMFCICRVTIVCCGSVLDEKEQLQWFSDPFGHALFFQKDVEGHLAAGLTTEFFFNNFCILVLVGVQFCATPSILDPRLLGSLFWSTVP